MKKSNKHLIVLSYDAFSCTDWELAAKQENLSKLINQGTFSNELYSVYPTLTYVVHSTIATGTYPLKHGIYHNNPLQPFIPENLQDWFWYRRDIKVPTIYEVAEKNHLTTAALLWPVSGKGKITYNIPEIRAIGNENQALKILKNGSPLYTLEMELKYGKYRNGIKQPNLDDFTTMCAVETIKKKKPNLLMVHLIDLDDAKHAYGTNSNEVNNVIVRMDKRIGDIMQAVEEAGIKDNTTFLILGDHGQIDISNKVRLNVLLKKEGLIYEEDGKLHWKAYIQGNGGSAYVHIKDKDKKVKEQVLRILNKAMTEDKYGIEHLYDVSTIKELKGPNVSEYMIEAKVGYSFEDDTHGEPVVNIKEHGVTYATHGFLPDKDNYQCNFLISGPNIKRNHRIDDIEMVDIAPTMATVLGIDFPPCDGRVLSEVFEG